MKNFFTVSLILVLNANCNQSWGKFWDVSAKHLTVLSISPGDGSMGNITQSVVTVTFSDAMLASSLTSNMTDTQCSGSVQISVNSFASCIRLPTLTLSAAKTTLTLTHVGIPNGQTAKIRLTTAISSAEGFTLSSQYTSSGFKTLDPPCGASNCVTGSQALGVSLGGGAHAFRIESGTHKDKYLIVQGGGTLGTRLYDTFTGTISAGPSLVTSANSGSHTISITTGQLASKMLLFRGGGSNATYVYDPATHAFTTNSATTIGAPNSMSYSHAIKTGTHAGKFFLIIGNGSNATEIYDPATNTFANNAPTFANNVGGDASTFYADSGIYAGSYYTICGGGSQNTVIYNAGSNSFSAGLATGVNITNGSTNFKITSGVNNGKTLIIAGGSLASTRLHDPFTGLNGAGPNVTTTTGLGSNNFSLEYGTNSGRVLLIQGDSLNTTNFYDPSIGTFTAAGTPTLPWSVSFSTEKSFVIEGGLYPGSIFITGNSNANYTLYFP